jgi:hypothetical protein
MSAFEGLGGDAVVAEHGGCAFAELFALLADDHYGLAGETSRPSLDIVVGAAACARDQSGVCREIVVDADIDQRRGTGGADES